MISSRILAFTSIFLVIVYYFVRIFFGEYGPAPNIDLSTNVSLLGVAAIVFLLVILLTTKWYLAIDGYFIPGVYNLLVVWIFICYIRSVLDLHDLRDLKSFLLGDITGLSLFPVLFFLVGINSKTFFLWNRVLLIYCLITFVISFFFLDFFEFQFFLLIPLFYLIITFPLQSGAERIITLIISISVIATSYTNRAGVLRILISYLIISLFYIALKLKVSKKLISVLVFIVIITPFYFLYLGLNGKDVFKTLLGENKNPVSGQENLRADTRTFLYVDVFRDLKINNAYTFGKGINAGYASDAFETYSRKAAEVGFLQIMLKCGILGFLLYIILIISAIFKALNDSSNSYLKYLGLLLCGYVLMLFIENIIAFNLFNIIIWCVVGVCHSKEIRAMNNDEMRDLFTHLNPVKR